MEQFRGYYAPGIPALVIGARTEFGKKYIGRVVTLEEEVTVVVPGYYARDNKDINYASSSEICWMVSGDVQSHDKRVKDGFACFGRHNLMPLPPLPEEAIQNEKEKEHV